MPRGRPRKSPDEKRLEGHHIKSGRPIPVDLFVPDGAPFVPDHLHDDAAACAEHIIHTFKTKRLAAPDSYVLSMFATAWAWHKAAVHAMNAPGFEPIIKGSSGQKMVNPWFKILNEQAHIMMSAAPKLYLTPADRANLVDVGKKKESKFDGLLGRTAILSARKESSPSSNASPSHPESGRA